jgi:hypothetical protein
MANRKVLIDSILGLAQKIGANPNKFMGTKSNINFLGTGDRGMKGTTFSGQLNEDFLDLGFGKNDMIKIIEQDAGYVTAGKLNDSQLNTMFNNLKMIDETFNPPPGPMNVIDLETGTVGLNKQGLESLRDTDKIKRFTQGLRTSKTAMSDKIKEGIESLKTKLTRDYGGDEIATKATAENNFIRSGAADFSDFVSAEGGRRAVVRQLMKNNANYFGLPPEMAESIAKSKDLGKGGSNFPDPLVVFRNVGNFTTDELTKIDEIIEANPFDDVKVIADKVSDYLQSIRPDGFTSAFAEGGRIGFKSGGIGKGIMDLIKGAFGKSPVKKSNVVLNETLTQNETKYLKELIEDTGGGQFTSDIMEEVPSLKIIDNKITIDKKDIDSLSNFLDNMYISDLAPSGRGVDKMPPRLRDTNNNLLIKLLRNEKAEGGRIGFKSGKSVKDGIAALLKLGNKKFGKDTLKVADDIEPSEFAKFNERNRALDDLDIEDYEGELGDPETWYTFGMTVREADELVKARKAYQAQMFVDYKAGRLDPKPGESGRKRFLEKKAEEAEMSGDSRLFTPDEADELAAMQKYGGPKTDDYYMKNLKTSDSINVDELPIELLDAEAIMVKYPGITERLARLIGGDTNLQRKAEALSAIDQAMALRGAGKSADETIEILET